MKRISSLLLVAMALLSFVIFPVSAEETLLQPTVNKDALLSALYEADVTSIRRALDLELLTCTELTQYYLDRIEQYNAPYNCFITICDDAMEIAKQRDQEMKQGNGKGILFGIPVVIKDNMDLAGYHTTNGHKKKASQIADSNADVVDYLLSEGAVIIAKANMSTDAQDALRSSSKAVGETKNAYSLYLSAGGSSGGSAVSTSLNFAVASLGTDTNSSLRIPAALAGCVSLRPTFGHISVQGIVKLNRTRDVPGAITRSVYDQAIMLDVLTQGKYSYTDNLNPDALEGMRIGVLKELSYATKKKPGRTEGNIDEEVAAAFENAISELENCGAEIVTVSMPKLFALSDKTFSNNKSVHKENLYEAFDAFLTEENISAVIFPTYLSTPIRSGKDADGVNWNPYSQVNINNCRTLSPSAGIPELSVPIGTHSLGAGIGMEIAARKGEEQLLLNIGYSYTSAYDHRSLPTGAPDSYSQHHEGALNDVVDSYLLELDAWMNPVLPTETVETQPETEETVGQHNENKMQLEDILQYWPFAIVVVVAIGLTVLLIVLIKRKSRQREQV